MFPFNKTKNLLGLSWSNLIRENHAIKVNKGFIYYLWSIILSIIIRKKNDGNDTIEKPHIFPLKVFMKMMVQRFSTRLNNV